MLRVEHYKYLLSNHCELAYRAERKSPKKELQVF